MPAALGARTVASAFTRIRATASTAQTSASTRISCVGTFPRGGGKGTRGGVEGGMEEAEAWVGGVGEMVPGGEGGG